MADRDRELERVRAEYARRAADKRIAGRYATVDPANAFIVRHRQQAFVGMLRAEGISTLQPARVLDVGCGSGGVLRQLADHGATPGLLHGFDLLAERLINAQSSNPTFNFVQGDAGDLPYAGGSFDLVLQFTVFSSIIDRALKTSIAAEMLRVLRPGGLIIWYDFWLNPTNPATRGIRPAEIKALFPCCRYRFRRVTLAPPIARKVAPRSRLAAELLQRLPFLLSHYMVAIRPLD